MVNGRLRLYEHLKKKHEDKESKSIRKQCLEEELEIIKNTDLDYIGMGDKTYPHDTSYLHVFKHGSEFSEKLRQAVIKVYLDEIKTL